MNALSTQGQYELTDFDAEILELFAAEYANEEETTAEIKRVYQTDAYIEDPTQLLPQQFIENTKRLLAMRLRQ